MYHVVAFHSPGLELTSEEGQLPVLQPPTTHQMVFRLHLKRRPRANCLLKDLVSRKKISILG